MFLDNANPTFMSFYYYYFIIHVYVIKGPDTWAIFSTENAMVVKLLHCDILYKMAKLNMLSRNATIVFNNTDGVYFQLVIFTKV